MIESKDITAVGKFQKTHALKGELNAILDIDPEFFEEENAIIVDIDGIFVPFFASGIRPKGSTSYLIKLDGIDTENEARLFVNKTLYANKNELGEFFEMEPEEILDEDDMVGYRLYDDAHRVNFWGQSLLLTQPLTTCCSLSAHQQAMIYISRPLMILSMRLTMIRK